MARQLVLLEMTGVDWRLDERTREIGRRGVAEAREVLRRAEERDREAAAQSQSDQPAA